MPKKAEKTEKKTAVKKEKKEVAKPKVHLNRSKRYAEIAGKVDKTKTYTIDEAIALAKETSTVKFDASVEIHIRTGIDVKKSDQQIRTTVQLPHPTGKKLIIWAIVPDDKAKEVKAAGAERVGGKELAEEIESTKKTNFDILVTTPDMMKDLSKIAKILGPKGLMPNPKTETVTPNPAKIVKDLASGKIAFKTDDTANIHVAIGKVSFEPAKLKENIEAFLDAVVKAKPTSVKGNFVLATYLTTSMGPSIKMGQS
jgi:large subunit ribosomal protein L1